MSAEEIEIKIDGDAPLSKKELRRIKKGKITLEELQKKKSKKLAKAAASGDKVASTVETESSKDSDESGEKDEKKNAEQPAAVSTGIKRSDYGIWIGNLSFETTREDLTNFITSKGEVSKSDISRVNLPTRGTKNRGFAYIDFNDEDTLNKALALSESSLNGRNVLIKNAKSYEGRPAKEGSSATATASKNPPSRILFVGNLSFDTTSELLQDHFKHCGEIIKIRMATFEDSGKCKGFAFIDFKDIEGPTNALKDRSCKKLINRPIRLEFGEDRSQRKVVPKRSYDEANESNNASTDNYEAKESHERSNKGFQPKQDKSFKRSFNSRPEPRMNSSVALAGAQRQSAAIVKSTGKKVTFD